MNIDTVTNPIIFREPPAPTRTGRGRPRSKQAQIAVSQPGQWILWTVRPQDETNREQSKKDRSRLSALAQSIRRYSKQDGLKWETAVRTENWTDEDTPVKDVTGMVVVLYARVVL